MSIKLLVVDDSAFMRKILTDLVDKMTGVEVVRVARNGLDALELIPKVKPDIITLDIEMPKLNGIETLKRIKENYDIPVIMLSSHSGRDITIEALQIGAVDFIEKPGNLKVDLSEFGRELELKIKSVVKAKTKDTDCIGKDCKKIAEKTLQKVNAVVIAASTGGPKALVYLIGNLPKKRLSIPIFIVQHMPKGFTTSFANRLNNEAFQQVVEAKDNMPIIGGTVYLAPGDYHMTLENNRIRLNQEPRIHGVRPAADYLFESAAPIYKDGLLGIILTGMGKDGTLGARAILEHGGYNIAQDEASCVVYGMPGNAVANEVVHEVLSLENISRKLNDLVR